MACATTVAISTTAVHVVSSRANIIAPILSDPERCLLRATLVARAAHIGVLVAWHGFDLTASTSECLTKEGLTIVEAVDGGVCWDVATSSVETSALAANGASGRGGPDGKN